MKLVSFTTFIGLLSLTISQAETSSTKIQYRCELNKSKSTGTDFGNAVSVEISDTRQIALQSEATDEFDYLLGDGVGKLNRDYKPHSSIAGAKEFIIQNNLCGEYSVIIHSAILDGKGSGDLDVFQDCKVTGTGEMVYKYSCIIKNRLLLTH